MNDLVLGRNGVSFGDGYTMVFETMRAIFDQ